MYFLIFSVVVALNPVLIPVLGALVWLWVIGSVGYLLALGDKAEGKPSGDVLGIALGIALVGPFLIFETWQALGVTMPYSWVWSLAKYGFLKFVS